MRLSEMLAASAAKTPIDYSRLADLLRDDRAEASMYLMDNIGQVVEDVSAMRAFYSVHDANPVLMAREIVRLRAELEEMTERNLDLAQQVKSKTARDRRRREKLEAERAFRPAAHKTKATAIERLRRRFSKDG